MSAAAAASDAHPHDLRARVPDRLPPKVVRELSKIRVSVALGAIAQEWVVIGLTIAATVAVPWLYPLAVVVIGARQHALAVIGHDAVHHRLLPNRRANDWVADLFVLWPVGISLEAFRFFHGDHHQHLGEPGDGNRALWRTHTADGQVAPEWRYPKTPMGFALKIARRAAFVTGLLWFLRSFAAAVIYRRSWGQLAVRVVYTAAIAAALTLAGAWWGFVLLWLVPFCTWHIAAQYIRLVCEHSGLPERPGAYGATRTTLARPWERFLLVPRNISLHIEHHWYPSVPFYNLRALHDALMQQPNYREHAIVTDSLMASIRQTVAGGR